MPGTKMSCEKYLGRIVTLTVSPRCILLPLIAVTLIYFIVYLLWASPASHGSDRRKLHIGAVKNADDVLHASHSKATLVNNELSAENEKGVWVRGRHIQIMSAIHDIHHPVTSETRLILPAFLRHSSERKFVCCFHSSLDSDSYIQVPARLDYIDLRFIVDLQNGAFECILRTSDNQADKPFTSVSFAPDSCSTEDVSPALTVVYPERRSWEFAVCTKVAYSRLEPYRLVEWFEYMQVVGASKILTYHNNLHPDTRRVFDYYVQTGLLELIEYKPSISEGETGVSFTERNSQSRQARHYKTLVVRDCQYRLGGYDFVMTIDFDELPVPLRPYGSLNWVLQDMIRQHSDGGAFRMDPILLPPEWQNTQRDLFHWQFYTGTYITPYCVKWAYVPGRTWVAATHENVPKEGYKTYVIPQDMLHFLHFRKCKPDWHELDCHNLTKTVMNETSLQRFVGLVLRGLRRLPLEELVPDKKYVNFVRSDPRRIAEAKQLDMLLSKHPPNDT